MKTQFLLFFFISISFFSCQDKVKLLNELDTSKDVKFYFLSSKIMGPRISRDQTEFQKRNQSFLINQKDAIQIMKDNWVFPVSKTFENFTTDYYLTYTENGIYRGKISIDLQNQLAISGYGPTTFDKKKLEKLQEYIIPLKTKFFEFYNLEEARQFHKAIEKKDWILPSPNDNEYYKWLEFEGECIVQINNKKFVKDKDIKKAFKKYMPKRFPNDEFYYNIFRFTPQNSTVRICSNKDLSDLFPEEFHVTIPWKKYSSIVIPLVNYNEQELKETLFTFNIRKYKIIDTIE